MSVRGIAFICLYFGLSSYITSLYLPQAMTYYKCHSKYENDLNLTNVFENVTLKDQFNQCLNNRDLDSFITGETKPCYELIHYDRHVYYTEYYGLKILDNPTMFKLYDVEYFECYKRLITGISESEMSLMIMLSFMYAFFIITTLFRNYLE